MYYYIYCLVLALLCTHSIKTAQSKEAPAAVSAQDAAAKQGPPVKYANNKQLPATIIGKIDEFNSIPPHISIPIDTEKYKNPDFPLPNIVDFMLSPSGNKLAIILYDGTTYTILFYDITKPLGSTNPYQDTIKLSSLETHSFFRFMPDEQSYFYAYYDIYDTRHKTQTCTLGVRTRTAAHTWKQTFWKSCISFALNDEDSALVIAQRQTFAEPEVSRYSYNPTTATFEKKNAYTVDTQSHGSIALGISPQGTTDVHLSYFESKTGAGTYSATYRNLLGKVEKVHIVAKDWTPSSCIKITHGEITGPIAISNEADHMIIPVHKGRDIAIDLHKSKPISQAATSAKWDQNVLTNVYVAHTNNRLSIKNNARTIISLKQPTEEKNVLSVLQYTNWQTKPQRTDLKTFGTNPIVALPTGNLCNHIITIQFVEPKGLCALAYVMNIDKTWSQSRHLDLQFSPGLRIHQCALDRLGITCAVQYKDATQRGGNLIDIFNVPYPLPQEAHGIGQGERYKLIQALAQFRRNKAQGVIVLDQEDAKLIESFSEPMQTWVRTTFSVLTPKQRDYVLKQRINKKKGGPSGQASTSSNNNSHRRPSASKDQSSCIVQ
jgi:hypothetical protein